MEVPLDSPAPWLVSQSRPRVERGARVVANQDGIPLIVASKQGDGTLMYLAFEPTTRNFRSWPGNEAMWRYLLTHAAVDNGVGSALVRPYLRWGGRPPRIAMADFSTHPKPTLDWFWVMAATYGLGLGGALLVLGRRGLVGTSLLAAIGVTGVVTLLGFTVARTRAEPEAAMTRVAVVRPIEVGEGSAAYTHEWISILARREGKFDFLLPDDALTRGLYYPFPRPSDESDAGWPFRVSEGAQPSLDDVPLRQGQLATAQMDGQLRQAPGVQADLLVERGALTGTVINRTGGRLSDAYLVVDNDIRPLGSLDRDQTSQVDILLPTPRGGRQPGRRGHRRQADPARLSRAARRRRPPRSARGALLGALPVRAHGAARADPGRLARALAERDPGARLPPEHGRLHAAGPAAPTAAADRLRGRSARRRR